MRARTIEVDWRIRSFIDIFRSVVALAVVASSTTPTERWSEVRIRPLFSTLRAGSGLLTGNDLARNLGGYLWICDTRLRQIDSRHQALCRNRQFAPRQ